MHKLVKYLGFYVFVQNCKKLNSKCIKYGFFRIELVGLGSAHDAPIFHMHIKNTIKISLIHIVIMKKNIISLQNGS